MAQWLTYRTVERPASWVGERSLSSAQSTSQRVQIGENQYTTYTQSTFYTESPLLTRIERRHDNYTALTSVNKNSTTFRTLGDGADLSTTSHGSIVYVDETTQISRGIFDVKTTVIGETVISRVLLSESPVSTFTTIEWETVNSTIEGYSEIEKDYVQRVDKETKTFTTWFNPTEGGVAVVADTIYLNTSPNTVLFSYDVPDDTISAMTVGVIPPQRQFTVSAQTYASVGKYVYRDWFAQTSRLATYGSYDPEKIHTFEGYVDTTTYTNFLLEYETSECEMGKTLSKIKFPLSSWTEKRGSWGVNSVTGWTVSDYSTISAYEQFTTTADGVWQTLSQNNLTTPYQERIATARGWETGSTVVISAFEEIRITYDEETYPLIYNEYNWPNEIVTTFKGAAFRPPPLSYITYYSTTSQSLEIITTVNYQRASIYNHESGGSGFTVKAHTAGIAIDWGIQGRKFIDRHREVFNWQIPVGFVITGGDLKGGYADLATYDPPPVAGITYAPAQSGNFVYFPHYNNATGGDAGGYQIIVPAESFFTGIQKRIDGKASNYELCEATKWTSLTFSRFKNSFTSTAAFYQDTEFSTETGTATWNTTFQKSAIFLSYNDTLGGRMVPNSSFTKFSQNHAVLQTIYNATGFSTASQSIGFEGDKITGVANSNITIERPIGMVAGQAVEGSFISWI
jgi:hypothetical protein